MIVFESQKVTKSGNMISLGFIGNIGRATIGLIRFATVGILNALKGLGALVLSFVTGGTPDFVNASP